MITRNEILAANAKETLIDFIAAAGYSQHEDLVDLLSEMHNSGEIDIPTACNSGQLDTISGNQFFNFQRVFCLTLPRIHCHAEDAITASTQVYRKAGADLAAGLAFKALREWFQQSSERTEEGLAMLDNDRDMDNLNGIVGPLLLAGAEQDSKRFAEVALDLSEHTQPQIRTAALGALGNVVPKDDDQLLNRALSRFSEVVEAEHSNQDVALAVEAALHLLHRTNGSIADTVRLLLEKACEAPSPPLRLALGRSLQNYRGTYDESMIDMTFSVLQTADKEDVNTIHSINSLLYEWDIDGDRDRVFHFLSKLLGGRDDAIELDALDNFRYRIRREKGEILGWYAVSLLLTGDKNLCTVAAQILPYNESRYGLDVDLGAFALAPPWIAFLTRKILGYCFHEKQSAAALLLSCLRAIPESNRAEIEDLIYDYFLMNYLTAIECFESAVSKDDAARESVNRLSLKLKSYLDTLSKIGKCSAFRPTERERRLQHYHQADFWRNIQKQAEENSVFYSLVHKATILYGTASIAYVYTDDSSAPRRQEIPMASHEHVAEFPRLDVIDRVGLQNAIHRFRSESPPV